MSVTIPGRLRAKSLPNLIYQYIFGSCGEKEKEKREVYMLPVYAMQTAEMN